MHLNNTSIFIRTFFPSNHLENENEIQSVTNIKSGEKNWAQNLKENKKILHQQYKQQ